MAITTAATKKYFNSVTPAILGKPIYEDFSQCEAKVIKYASLDDVYEFDEPARNVISRIIPYLSGEYKSVLIDYKVRNLEAGNVGCPIEGWHTDVTRNPNHPTKPDRHFIFATDFGTEFLLNLIDCAGLTDFSQAKIDKEVVWKAPPNCIVHYGRSNLHRAPRVTKSCKRVLIRVTETDIITRH